MYANIGCLLSAADAFMQDVQPFLIADALADFSEAEHRRALEYGAARCAGITHAAALLALDGAAKAADGWTPARVRAEVAAALGVPAGDLRGDDDLLLGLDSIRLMLLTEDWQRAGARVTYADVAARPTLDALTDLLCAAGAR
ncbi:phosphopantetheine-binding protein [Deinococcus sp. RM]|uniref:phosphopantetheine-binding protein n=1 Tax=Deinococcus sp. RM TaxID=2316359 RepID=UPI003AB543BD